MANPISEGTSFVFRPDKLERRGARARLILLFLADKVEPERSRKVMGSTASSSAAWPRPRTRVSMLSLGPSSLARPAHDCTRWRGT
jgi:hypothetical protein